MVDSVELLGSLNGKSTHQICRPESDIDEIEQYYNHDLIGHDRTVGGKLSIPEIDEKYRSLYQGKETTWFSHIPLKIELDITKKCNLHCKHCSRPADSNSAEGKLTLQDYINVIEEAGKLGVPDISFMGGEPTCSPSFIQLAAYARMSGFRMFSTSTNGWLVDEKLVKDMAALFDVVQVSIHGADAETHDAIVGRSGAFDRACGNLDKAIGNVRDDRIMDLWHSPMMIRLRNRPTCDCAYSKICSGGCLGMNIGVACSTSTPPRSSEDPGGHCISPCVVRLRTR
jgi:radical SAM protein with 4Fe4S-binding SPASM domain